MLHCTYYNPNRVMAGGYLHAVEVTFLSHSWCVLYDPSSCLMSIFLEAMAPDVLMNGMNELHLP